MAAEEGDWQRRAARGEGAQEAPVRPGPPRPLHPVQCLSLAQVRPCGRPR